MHFFKDIIIIILSVLAGVLMSRFGFVDWMLGVFHYPMIASFVAGIFFTSLLTISPASIVLADLGTRGAPLEIAFFGALGAVVGDMILFFFIKDKVSTEIAELLKNKIEHYHLDRIHSKYARWMLPAIGAVIIASPLPDELGIMFMGAAKMKTKTLIPVSFVMNFIGVLLVIAMGDIAISH
jgi:uncharacterized membrane protein YdjX (TVP38/TMEM64 family)